MARWLVFAGLGPPIGLTSLLALILLDQGRLPPVPLAELLLEGLGLSYAIGLIPALAAALVTGLLRRRGMSFEILWVALTGAAIGMALLIVVASGHIEHIEMRMAILFVVVCLVPTLACWHLSRRLDKTTKIGDV